MLGELPGHQDAREIALSWNHNTHFCMVVASSMHVISQLVDRLCSNQPQQNRLANIALVVAVLPLIVSTLRATKYSPLYVGCNGRIIMPVRICPGSLPAFSANKSVLSLTGCSRLQLRYLSWSTTTSLLLYLLWLTTNAPFSEFRTAWAANLTMLVTGFLSTTVGGAAFWLFAASSFVSFGIVVNVGYQWYADTRDISKALSGTNSALSVVYILALGSWTTFPSIWIWAELFGSNLSASAEEMLWVVCDFAAKLVQSTALFQVSYTDLRLSRRFGDLLTPGGRTALEDESWGQELLYQWGQAESRDVSSLGYCLCTFEAFLFILASSIEAVQLRNAIGRKATALFSRTIRESSRVAWCASWSRAREEPGGDYLVPNCPVLLRADIASTFPQGVLCTYEDRVACILEDTRNTMLRETHIMQERYGSHGRWPQQSCPSSPATSSCGWSL